MRREVIVENKKTKKKEKALFKIIRHNVWLISNLCEYNGAPLEHYYKEGFNYSYVLLSPKKNLNQYKNFKEFNDDLGLWFCDKHKSYNFSFIDEKKYSFKEISL